MEEEKKPKKKPGMELCPIRNILSRFGDKWSTLVLTVLHNHGTLRFNQIHRELPDISQRMLTVTLRTLTEDGLVNRKVFAEVPPRIEYTLTETGESLIPHLNGLVEWAEVHGDLIRKSREEIR